TGPRGVQEARHPAATGERTHRGGRPRDRRRPAMTTGPARVEPRLRLATAADREAISALMKASTRDLFPAFYDHRQTASSVEYIAHIDPVLIDDRTYYVAEVDGDLVACGGWSRRDKLSEGHPSRRSVTVYSTPGRRRRAFERCSSAA